MIVGVRVGGSVLVGDGERVNLINGLGERVGSGDSSVGTGVSPGDIHP